MTSTQQQLVDLLLEEHSKRQIKKVANLIEKQPALLNDLIDLCVAKDPKFPQRASWCLDELTLRHPHWIDPYVELLSASLPKLYHDGNRRNICKVLSRSPLPKQELGTLLNTTFEWVASRESAIAVRVHSITVLVRIAQVEPDIKEELKLILEELLHIGSNGEKSKARHALKQIMG